MISKKDVKTLIYKDIDAIRELVNNLVDDYRKVPFDKAGDIDEIVLVAEALICLLKYWDKAPEKREI